MTTALDIALDYIGRGWNPVPVPHRKKKPIGDEWQLRIIDASNAAQHFNGQAMNIGVVLGPSSHGLTDIDLDCEEARAIAPYILPRTGAIFGRSSSRAAHRLYYTDLSVTADKAVQNFDDPGPPKARILELRIGGTNGAQTVFPGSTHEDTGEAIVWEENGAPASVDGDDLTRRIHALAAYGLIARHWAALQLKHDAALVVGGFLARAGKNENEIGLAMEAIARAVNDPEWKNRRDAAKDAAKAFREGKKAFGFPAMCEAFGEAIAKRAAEWLGYSDIEQQQFEYTEDEVGATRPKMAFLNLSRWINEPPPPREWAVLDRIPLRQTTLFSGEGAAGKSTILLHEIIAGALAKDWLGTLPEPGSGMLIECEDDDNELWRRSAAILNHFKATYQEAIAGGLYLKSYAGEDAVMATVSLKGKVEPTAIYKEVLEAAGDLKPKHIGIASSANVFAGKENDRSQVQQFIGMLTRIAIVANGGLTLASHPSLTGITNDSGISGTTQWHNAVRARYYLKSVNPEPGEQPDSDLREIIFKKNNYGPISTKIVLRYQNGLFLPIAGVSSLERAAIEQTAENVFLDLLKRFAAANRNVSDRRGPGYAPTAFAREDEAKRANLNSKDLEAAMRRLFKIEKIWNEPYGKPSRQHFRIAIKP